MTTPIATSTIAQQAFRFMELSPLSSFADDSPQAQAASEQYPEALRICLEEEDWSFARRLVSLPPIGVLPAGLAADPTLPVVYRLPGDLVRLNWVADEVSWRRDEDLLRTDTTGQLLIRYTRLIDNEKALPALFRTAVSYQLAILLAPLYVGSRTKRADLAAEGLAALERAVTHDNRSASARRWDGQPASGDWATGATR
ncbi:hypothetical protein [Oceanicola sp. S124]|uniref:hypothetical protein n=1 Tax=Oceanicola sp. S124 TaxID=1042378 RepID=UPI0002558992|nr:hypothetical protein [Oceanicola sp. S124]